MFAKDADRRSCTFEKALNLGEEFKRRKQNLLVLRAAVLRNQIHVSNLTVVIYCDLGY